MRCRKSWHADRRSRHAWRRCVGAEICGRLTPGAGGGGPGLLPPRDRPLLGPVLRDGTPLRALAADPASLNPAPCRALAVARGLLGVDVPGRLRRALEAAERPRIAARDLAWLLGHVTDEDVESGRVRDALSATVARRVAGNRWQSAAG